MVNMIVLNSTTKFAEILQEYPVLDITWELFKGIAPTLVALLAILINNSRAIKRDKINKQNDIKISLFKDLLQKYIDYQNLIEKSAQDILKNYQIINHSYAPDRAVNLRSNLMNIAEMNNALRARYDVLIGIIGRDVGINLVEQSNEVFRYTYLLQSIENRIKDLSKFMIIQDGKILETSETYFKEVDKIQQDIQEKHKIINNIISNNMIVIGKYFLSLK